MTKWVLALVIGGAGALVMVGGYLALAGSAVVVDETGGVVSAVITNSGGSEQPLHHLWRGYFYAIPEMEGSVEIRCRNGLRKQWGYVTANEHTRIRVEGARPCARMMDEG